MRLLLLIALLALLPFRADAQTSTHWTACYLHLDWATQTQVVVRNCYDVPMPREQRPPIGQALLRTVRLSPHVKENVYWPTFAQQLPGCPPAIAQWAAPIYDASHEYGIPLRILTGIIDIESKGDPSAYNTHSGASGLMQIIPPNFAWLHLTAPFNGYANIQAGAMLLSSMGMNIESYSGGGYGLGLVLARSCD